MSPTKSSRKGSTCYASGSKRASGASRKRHTVEAMGQSALMGTVELVPYSRRWPDEFRHVAAELRAALNAVAIRIDHVGSTSVPELAAKDVLDVQVAVASLDVERLVDALEPAGYRHVPGNDRDHIPPGADRSDEGWRKAFFGLPSSRRRVNVHVRVAGAPNTRYALLFRDYLRAHPDAALAYGELKRRLASLEPPLDLGTYADVKDPACDIVIAAAEDWARKRGCKGMSVRSNVIRERAHQFYLRNGYEHFKTQKSFRKPL